MEERNTSFQPEKNEMYIYDETTNSYKPLATIDGAIPVIVVGGSAGGGSSLSFLNGTTAPNNSNGVDGDVYLNTTNGDMYKKSSGTWSLLMNLKGVKGDTGVTGTKGADGSAWLSGAVAPTTEGKTGDFYLNTANFDVYSKATGSWVKTGNIKGATGTAGTKGADGTTPVKGTDYFTAADIASLNIPTKTSQLTNDSNFATVKTRNIITAYPNANYKLTADATYETLPLAENLKVGTGFTITADNGIQFAKTGIVTVSLKVTYNSVVKDGLKWATAYLGTTPISANSVSTNGRETLVGHPLLLEVTAGQILYLKVSGGFDGTNGDEIRSGKEYSSITVEYID